MKIKPIETNYKGYRFRSRLEARWAVFLDALGIDWEYEKEGYDLGDKGWYLPDFYTKMVDAPCGWYIEIKGDVNDKEGISKAAFLDNNPPDDSFGCLILRNLEYAKPFNHTALAVQALTIGSKKSFRIDEINRAITKARQARFEHGEIG